jgi:hypothetical protein
MQNQTSDANKLKPAGSLPFQLIDFVNVKTCIYYIDKSNERK